MTPRHIQSSADPHRQFALAMQHMRAGNPLAAEDVLLRFLQVQPRHAEGLHCLGVIYAMGGRPDRAEVLIRQALAVQPDYVEALGDLGNVLQQMHRVTDAAACFREVARLRPDAHAAHYNLAIALEQMNQPAQALDAYDRAIALEPGFAEALVNRGNVLETLGRYTEALASYDRALALNAGIAEAWGNRGQVLEKLRRFEEALADYDKALAIRTDFPEAHNNRGHVLEELQRNDEALASYDRAIALNPQLAAAHSNRGGLLAKLDRYQEALASHDRALALAPDSAELLFNRANALNELDRSMDAMRDYERALQIKPEFLAVKNNVLSLHMKEGKDIPLIERLCEQTSRMNLDREIASLREGREISDFRVLHDLEQTAYLLEQGYDCTGLEEAHACLNEIYARCRQTQGHTATTRAIALSDGEIGVISRFRGLLLRYQAPADIEFCLNPDNDWRAIEDQYFSTYPEMIYIDNLLSPQALQEMRKFCLVSTVWKREYSNQYLGAFPNTGFVSPMHVRIASELQQRMPRVYGGHRLEQLWGYKYTPKMGTGISVHADFSRVNLNFWVTPDEANLNPETGGLIVYYVPSPASWSFHEYNVDKKKIYDFLDQNGSGSMRVPHRCNRAVFFNSTLFHETDEINFREGYGNRRINITYLFGRGLKVY